MQGKGGVDTVPPSTEVGQLAHVGWDAGWEESEVQEGRKAPGKSPSPAGGQRRQQPLTKEPPWAGAVGRSGICKGCAQPVPSRLPRYSQCPTDTQKSKKRVCIPSSKAQLGLQIQMYGQNVNAL